jgi:hypothetical protein
VFDVRRGNEVGMRFGTGVEISSRGAQYRYPSLKGGDTGYWWGAVSPVSQRNTGVDTGRDTGIENQYRAQYSGYRPRYRTFVGPGRIYTTQLSLDSRFPNTRQHGSKPDTLWTRGTSSPSSTRKLLSRPNLRMV